MKQRIIYCCEFCSSFWSDSQAICEAHEASHFGLTRKEYLDWRILTKEAGAAGRDIGISNNQNTRIKFGKAIEALCSFEEEHGLKDEIKKPSDFYL